jgi:hypothetical protein
MGQLAGEGDGRATDRADGGGAGAVEEGAGALVAADLLEARSAQ